MRRALRLARKGIGLTHPNPRVGAVVVAAGAIVGEGWHERPGLPHAEILALRQAGMRARGGTLYVTLEPCAGHGRTPPCTRAIRTAGIRRVVFGSSDPNPRMAGGAATLRGCGIEVTAHVLRERTDALNRPFFHFLHRRRSYVIAKAAMSLDGKLATHTEQSQWISGAASRRHAQRLRAEADAIVVGANTLRRDNPALTVRHALRRGAPPLRVVICSHTPEFDAAYKLADGSAPARLYVTHPDNSQTDAWRSAGVEVVCAAGPAMVLRHLASEGRLAVLLEGGGRLHASFFAACLTDELVLYQAPLLIGGVEACGLWHGPGVDCLAHAPRLADIHRRRIGDDLLIRGRMVYPE